VKLRYLTAAGLLCWLLVACQSLGLAPAKSLSDRLAYGYGTLSAVEFAAADATNAGELSKADAQTVLKLADQSRTLLDGAKSLLEALRSRAHRIWSTSVPRSARRRAARLSLSTAAQQLA